MYLIVSGKLELFYEPPYIQYQMLTKPYVYRARVNPDGSFIAIIKDKSAIEKLKEDFKVKELVEKESLGNLLI